MKYYAKQIAPEYQICDYLDDILQYGGDNDIAILGNDKLKSIIPHGKIEIAYDAIRGGFWDALINEASNSAADIFAEWFPREDGKMAGVPYDSEYCDVFRDDWKGNKCLDYEGPDALAAVLEAWTGESWGGADDSRLLPIRLELLRLSCGRLERGRNRDHRNRIF